MLLSQVSQIHPCHAKYIQKLILITVKLQKTHFVNSFADDVCLDDKAQKQYCNVLYLHAYLFIRQSASP